MRKVKTQPAGSNERTGLLDVIAQYLSKGSMEQMSGRMVGGNLFTAAARDGQGHLLPDGELALDDHGIMENHGLALQRCRIDLRLAVLPAYHPAVADLTAGFGIKRGRRDNDFTTVTGAEFSNRLPLAVDQAL